MILSDIESEILQAIATRKEPEPGGLQVNYQVFIVRGRTMNMSVMLSAMHAMEKKDLITSRPCPIRRKDMRLYKITDLGRKAMEHAESA
jgi:DNA-binding PadR family transcriptional regulator